MENADNSAALLIALYFLPTLLAIVRLHRNTLPILIVNAFLGWTLIGWVVALAWSVTAARSA